MKRIFAFCSLILILCGFLNSQTIINPNYSLKSHETLNIIKVEAGSEATIFYMSIENKIEKGSFCADKNIYIIYPDGKKSKLESSSPEYLSVPILINLRRRERSSNLFFHFLR